MESQKKRPGIQDYIRIGGAMSIFVTIAIITASAACAITAGGLTYKYGHQKGYSKACDDILRDLTDIQERMMKAERPQEVRPWSITR